ncbi:MAG: hypothetical protein Q4C20_12995 [Erysipelotrichaceae bacterium]|nr:hypothetical protein [Erysipelotrichaceae bacterium]
MLKRNEIIKFCGTYYRVLAVRKNEVLLIDCQKRKMPHWQLIPNEYDTVTITEIYKQTGIKPESISSVSVERLNIACLTVPAQEAKTIGIWGAAALAIYQEGTQSLVYGAAD